MNYFVDQDKKEIILDDQSRIPLYSPAGFRLLSDLWLKVGWDQKHLYSFTWLGRPIIQLPEDALRMQEVIYSIKPDVVIETGIAHGGSLILWATVCKAIGRGRVIGIDVEIRPHNRRAIEQHELFSLITLIEEDSISDAAIDRVRGNIRNGETALVILDSNHTYRHAYREIVLYSRFVTPGSYIVATDGSRGYLHETPRAWRDYPDCGDWPSDNPKNAAEDFVKGHSEFRIVEPPFRFNEGAIGYRVTYWPSAFIQRVA